jgi:hypothetical protein
MSRNPWPAIVGLGLVALVLLGPLVCLAFAALALRRRNYDRAETMSTVAGVGSWILLGIEGLVMVPFLFRGGGFPWLDPLGAAFLSYPPLLWFFARAIRRSTARRREEDRAARRFLREEAREQAADRKRRAREAGSKQE